MKQQYTGCIWKNNQSIHRLCLKKTISGQNAQAFARLITYFLCSFFAKTTKIPKTGSKIFISMCSVYCSVKKVNKLLCNILVTWPPKTTKNQVTKMGWKAHKDTLIFTKFLGLNTIVLKPLKLLYTPAK